MSKLYTNEELNNLETALKDYSNSILKTGAHDGWVKSINILINQARAYNMSTEKPNIFRGAVNNYDDGSC